MSEITRLQVDILKSQLKELERLQKLGGLRSKRELWDTAFTFLKWATKKKALGLAIGSVNAEGVFTELEMPFLEDYASNAREESSEETSNGNGAAPAEGSELGVAASATNGADSNGNIHLARKKRTA